MARSALALTVLLAALATACRADDGWDWSSQSRSRENQSPGKMSTTWASFMSGEESAADGVWDAFLAEQGRDVARASAVSAGCADTVLAAIERDGELSLLLKAAGEIGLIDALSGPGPVTLIAPTDSAFINLGADERTSAALSMDLGEVIRYHVSTDEVVGGQSQRMSSLTGAPITLSLSSGSPAGISANGQPVLDITRACNGQVLKVGAVLVPGTPLTPSPLPLEKATCARGECCDLQPPGEFSCEEQVRWGKCEEDWVKSGGFCRKACGLCIGEGRRSAGEVVPVEEGTRSTRTRREGAPLSDYAREGILVQHWKDIPGWKISDMVTSPKVLEEPTNTMVLKPSSRDGKFEVPQDYARAQNGASRMSGFFCAPLSGDYMFFFTSDDSGRLFISDGPVGQKKRLAKIDGSRGPEDFTKARPIQLERGESYFLEAMQKQLDGAGHLKVGVQLPNGGELIPIPASFFSMGCERMPKVEMPRIDPEEACACTEDGFSGQGTSRVQTGREGCFTYDYREDMVSGAGRLGGRFGEGIGNYFQRRWGAEEGTAARLASYWSNFAAEAADSSENTSARICYVRYPESCPIAIPSRQVRGASWRRC